MYKCGLLLLTCPLRSAMESISNHLKVAAHNVRFLLYVKLEPGKDLSQFTRLRHDLGLIDRFIPVLYSKAAVFKPLEVILLLGSCKNPDFVENHVSSFDIILTDSSESDSAIQKYAQDRFGSACPNFVRLQKYSSHIDENIENFKLHENIVLGGTFDILHNGHRVLLNSAILRTTKKLVVGITDGCMLRKKALWELILPLESRIDVLRMFLQNTDPSINYTFVPIYDPFGPAIEAPDLDCIVVSDETKKGGDAVNVERTKKGLKPLDVVVINLVDETDRKAYHENKISSSNLRRELLGTYFKLPARKSDESFPILIGLVGEIKNVRSRLANEVEAIGAAIIDCHNLLLSLFISKSEVVGKLIEDLGKEITGSDGHIDSKMLYAVALLDKSKRQKINAVILPELISVIENEVTHLKTQGFKYVALDMPLFAEGNWFGMVDEVWATIMPIAEKIQKLQKCYTLSSDEASDVSCDETLTTGIVKYAHVVFSPNEDPLFLKQQVIRAWEYVKSNAAKLPRKP